MLIKTGDVQVIELISETEDVSDDERKKILTTALDRARESNAKDKLEN